MYWRPCGGGDSGRTQHPTGKRVRPAARRRLVFFGKIAHFLEPAGRTAGLTLESVPVAARLEFLYLRPDSACKHP
ncbi:hypothetical protein RR42_m4171 [Cupriavidus basilensis]|uniref:Uncharacterized protein n=1 Tax=Cupriavidus basilensis TaxID=68895 RepID=A0A0C4YF71_9BURK|nr:hypothetical protein RR42_m4171 [Cupriavidus basilensis]